MPLTRPSLAELEESIYKDYLSRFAPVSNSARNNLIKTLALVDAGKFHLLHGNLEFLSRQIFPDTAEAEYLRAHWSDRVAPRYATTARGRALIKGITGITIPIGLIFSSPSGKTYYVESQATVQNLEARLTLIAVEPGSESNLPKDTKLTITSAVPQGLDSFAIVTEDGISGGEDAESDQSYLARVLQSIRTGHLYGKPGDWALWAASAGVAISKAWEFVHYSPLGNILIQVIAGNQADGLVQVGEASREAISRFIGTVAPPVPYSIETPIVKNLDVKIQLLPGEDSQENRDLIRSRLVAYLEANSKPKIQITQSQLQAVVVDGTAITDATVLLNTSAMQVSMFEIFTLGVIIWL